jgi:hypothetical protein
MWVWPDADHAGVGPPPARSKLMFASRDLVEARSTWLPGEAWTTQDQRLVRGRASGARRQAAQTLQLLGRPARRMAPPSAATVIVSGTRVLVCRKTSDP